MAIPVPGPLVDEGVWEELRVVVQKRAKLSKQQRDLQIKVNQVAHDMRGAEEEFIAQAQSIYERMSDGELDEAKAESAAVKAHKLYEAKVADLERQRGESQRRIEALRRSLDKAESRVEMTVKASASEKITASAERTQGIAGRLEAAIFAAQELSREARDQYMAIQWLNQYLGVYERVNPRQLGSGSGASFGSAPETVLQQAQMRTKEMQAELERIHGELTTEPEPREPVSVPIPGNTDDPAQTVPQDPSLPKGWSRTASGTPYQITDD
jgi:hypothetical protein